MKALVTALALGGAVWAAAEDNLVKNGDFSTGGSHWDGEEEIEYERPGTANRVCRMDVDEDEDIAFRQKIRTRGLQDLALSFRVRKSEDYDGRGIHVRFRTQKRPWRLKGGRFVTFSPRLPRDDQWKTCTITFSDLREADDVTIEFVVRRGNAGYVMFDDVSVTGR